MLYRELKPSGAAAQFVKCFWMLEDASPSSDIQRILPDGRCELIFNLATPFEMQSADGWKCQPQSFAVGQITGPMTLRSTGPAMILGVRFHAHGFSRLLRMPADELTDKQASLEEVALSLSRRIEPLHDLSSSDLEALSQIMDHGASDVPVDRQIAYATTEFERTAGAIPVSDMARQLGLSTRQFERRFKAAVGISPKTFCRIQRFQHVLRKMDAPDQTWVNVATDCGYYDQAHLIRDFQQFAGKAPTALLTEEINLSRRFAS